MKKSLVTTLVACFLFFIFLLSPSLLLADRYQVTRVIDGDTIKVEDGSKKITVRLVGIDAPETSKRKNEPGQPFSQRATKHLASLVLNQTVEIKSYGNDRDGRMLGEVFFWDRNINLEMVKAGLAEVYRGKPAPASRWQNSERLRRRPERPGGVFGYRGISISVRGSGERRTRIDLSDAGVIALINNTKSAC